MEINWNKVNWNEIDFSLSAGCFGTDIIQKCTKWSQIGAHGLKIGQIFAKCQCASFLIRNIWKYDNMIDKMQKCSFRTKIFEKLHGPYPSWKKQKIDIIQLNLVSFVLYNQILLKSIKNHINVRKFDKKHLTHARKTTPLKLKSAKIYHRE